MKKGDLTRNKILNETIVQIGKHGFHATSFQSIADGCSIGQMAVLRHFPNRKILLTEVLKKISLHNHSLVEERMSVTDDAVTRLLKYCEVNLDWAMQFPAESQVILLLYYNATFDDDFSDLFSKILKQGRDRVLGYFLSAYRENLIRVDKEILPQISELFHEALIGNIICVISASDDLAKKNLENSIIKLKLFLTLNLLKTN